MNVPRLCVGYDALACFIFFVVKFDDEKEENPTEKSHVGIAVEDADISRRIREGTPSRTSRES